MIKIILAAILVLSPVLSFAADQLLYVRDGATGTTCSDWASGNACDQISTAEALVDRSTYDDVYIFVADGSYGKFVIDAAVSGTKRLHIKKATVAAHGTETGWDNAYGDGQAVIQAAAGGGDYNYTIQIHNTSYITIDGVAAATQSDPSTYGFKVMLAADFGDDPASTYRVNAITIGGTGHTSDTLTNIVLQYIASVGPTSEPTCSTVDGGCENESFYGASSNMDTVEVHHCYSSGYVNNARFERGSNISIHDNYFTTNRGSATGQHGQNLDMDALTGVSIYNNLFLNSFTFVIAIHANIGITTGLKIYNNIIDGAQDSISAGIASMSGQTDEYYGAEIHHNTFLNFPFGAKGAVYQYALTDAATNHSHAYNNLFYNCVNPIIADTVVVHDYNAYLKCTGTITAEDNDQTDAGADDPFTDSANGDYSLKSGTLPIDHGTTLAAAYDDDKAGVTRPKGTAWDMGAYEYEAPAGSWIVTFTTTSPCTASAAVAVANGATGEGTLTVPDAYKHGTTSSGTWSGNVVTTAAITADTEVTLGCETRKYGGLVKP